MNGEKRKQAVVLGAGFGGLTFCQQFRHPAARVTWENLVWSSKDVNTRKGNRLPHEAGLKLLSVPWAPKELRVSAIIRNAHDVMEWKLFLNEQNNGRAGVKTHSSWLDGQNWNNVMGATRDDFIKYPRTPHLFGSKGTDDDKHLSRQEFEGLIADPSLIVEEKIDGTNVGIHFTSGGRMVLQCRGREITEGNQDIARKTQARH